MKPGYYWVLIDDEWRTARYYGERRDCGGWPLPQWSITGYSCADGAVPEEVGDRIVQPRKYRMK